MLAVGFKRGYVYLVLFLLMVSVAGTGCDRNVSGPPEEYPVQGTVVVNLVDFSGMPVQAPVSFKIKYQGTSQSAPETGSEELMVLSDVAGQAKISRTFHLKVDEVFTIIADVSCESHESLNYWTAYFRSTDAPAREVAVQLTVLTK
jgi:hypothetical protein